MLQLACQALSMETVVVLLSGNRKSVLTATGVVCPRIGASLTSIICCADTVLQLACKVLSMETMLVALLDGNRKFVITATGMVSAGISMEPPAICHWSLVPSLHQMVIVEDTLEDARSAAISCHMPHAVQRCLRAIARMSVQEPDFSPPALKPAVFPGSPVLGSSCRTASPQQGHEC